MTMRQSLPMLNALMQALPVQQQQAQAGAGAQVRMFARMTKIDEPKRMVYGRMVQEVVDKSKEIFDYTKSEPYFRAWSAECAKATDGKSQGNVRAMHNKVAAGVVKEMEFIDAEKAIDIGAKVVDDAEWNKCLEGVYTGFSIGGHYVERWTEKADGDGVTRYAANPFEVSLVDNPCVPTAQFFDIVKADGLVVKTAFARAVAEPLTVRGSDDEVEALVKAMNDKGMTMAELLAVVAKGHPGAGDDKPAAAPAPAAAAAGAVDKGLWNVQDLASCLACLASVASSAESEASFEGDKSPVPEKLRAIVSSLAGVLKEMTAEETAEMLSDLKTQAGSTPLAAAYVSMCADVGALAKLYRRIADPALTMAQAGELSKSYGEAIGPDFAARVLAKAAAKDHSANVQAMHALLGRMGAKCDADKAVDASAGDVAKLTATVDDLTKQVQAMRNQPLTVGLARLAVKGAPVQSHVVDPNSVALEPADYVLDGRGEIDYGVSRMMKAQKLASAA